MMTRYLVLFLVCATKLQVVCSEAFGALMGLDSGYFLASKISCSDQVSQIEFHAERMGTKYRDL